MIKFGQYINESTDVVAHLEHAEDFVLNGGVAGTRQAIQYLIAVRDALAGKSGKPINTTIKYDGAPSIFAGIDPTDGKFFVAKKGIFNKNPKVYKTQAEVAADTSGELAEKLSDALKYLPELGIKGIVQGDFMYSKADLKKQVIDGQNYLTFHPNTIVYAVPADSDLATRMMASKIGIVWHTIYHGDSFETMKAQGGTKIASTLKQSKNVWFDDVVIKDLSGSASMTEQETAEVTAELSKIGKLFHSMNPHMLNDIHAHDVLMLIKTFNNSKVRKGEKIVDPTHHAHELFNWIHARHQGELTKLKTEKGKAAHRHKNAPTYSFFAKYPVGELAKVFELMNLITDVKNTLIKKLHKVSTLQTFLKTKDGFRVTGQEGYVVTDHLGKNAMKLVDRIEFSAANFSADVIKGWEH